MPTTRSDDFTYDEIEVDVPSVMSISFTGSNGDETECAFGRSLAVLDAITTDGDAHIVLAIGNPLVGLFTCLTPDGARKIGASLVAAAASLDGGGVRQ